LISESGQNSHFGRSRRRPTFFIECKNSLSHERFSALYTGIGNFAVRDLATLEKRVGEADVLVISGLWRDSLLGRAQRSGALAAHSLPLDR
jgi:hypothetical protein